MADEIPQGEEQEIDPEAPYGRNRNGTPLLRPPVDRSIQRERRGYVAEYCRRGIYNTAELDRLLDTEHDIRVPALTIQKDVNLYLRRVIEEQHIGRAAWQARLIDRLVAGQQAIFARIQRGDDRAIHSEIAIQRRISEMLGLDATPNDRTEDFGAQLNELINAQDIAMGKVPSPPSGVNTSSEVTEI